MNRIAVALLLLCILICSVAGPTRAQTEAVDPLTVHIFYKNAIRFDPDHPNIMDTRFVKSLDNGRVVERTVVLEHPAYPVRIFAHLSVRPIPKDDSNVHDKWDRAGNVRLSIPNMAEIEVIKFITAYGGATEYDVDITHLAPLLDGPCAFRGFIDTWIDPAWEIDFHITFAPDEEALSPDWVSGVFFEESVTEESMRDGDVETEVVIPDGIDQVTLHYLVSGHCTDGRGDDEFESKENVISVNGQEIYRFRPWRDDCLRFRTINPYCRRWSDGSWSSDYSRSGWCPGDLVRPVEVDLSRSLKPGKQTVGFRVERIRPKGEDDQFGYWRVSGYLVGRRAGS